MMTFEKNVDLTGHACVLCFSNGALHMLILPRPVRPNCRRLPDKSTAGPLQGGLPKISGYERRGDSYAAMFQGLEKGIGL